MKFKALKTLTHKGKEIKAGEVFEIGKLNEAGEKRLLDLKLAVVVQPKTAAELKAEKEAEEKYEKEQAELAKAEAKKAAGK